MFMREHMYFYHIKIDKLFIPNFDVSSVKDYSLISDTFIDDFNKYIDSLIFDTYEELKNHLYSNFNIIEKEKVFIKFPRGFVFGIIHNFPDFYDANENEILSFLHSTRIHPNDIKVRTFRELLITRGLTPTNFQYFDITNKYRFVNYIEKYYSHFISQKLIKPHIWISIVLRWGYENGDLSDHNQIIGIIHKYCIPYIFNCDNFIMINVYAHKVNNQALITWMNDNINNIAWDEDLLSDLETFYIRYPDYIQPFYNHPFYLKEYKNREGLGVINL